MSAIMMMMSGISPQATITSLVNTTFSSGSDGGCGGPNIYKELITWEVSNCQDNNEIHIFWRSNANGNPIDEFAPSGSAAEATASCGNGNTTMDIFHGSNTFTLDTIETNNLRFQSAIRVYNNLSGQVVASYTSSIHQTLSNLEICPA